MKFSWTRKATQSYKHARNALKTADDLFQFAKSTGGKPSTAERALFAATIVFIYGIWENFVEQLAIEIVSNLAPVIEPSKLPNKIRKKLEGKSAWELLVHPGWRELWLELVKTEAVGDDSRHGLNTAKSSSVQHLLGLAGLENVFASLPPTVFDAIPEHIMDSIVGLEKSYSASISSALDSFVTLRGEIVHTGKVPQTLKKHHVKSWKSFIEVLIKEIDSSCRTMSKEYLS